MKIDIVKMVDAKEQQIDKLDNMEVIYHPSKERLRELYQSSRCTLLLSKRKTFSMVALESIASGTPVIGFKNGGTESWLGEDGFVSYGDINALNDKVMRLDSKKVYKNVYRVSDIASQYIDLYNNR